MIDTVYAPPLGALALQWNNYVNYMTPFPITHSTGVVLISSKYFNKIPGNLATIFKDEIKNSLTELTSELISQTSEAIDIIKTNGVTISPMPAEPDMEEFYSIRDQVANRLIGKVYPAELLKKVYQILDRVRKTP
jgi:TRAP-type C4-dicarboxylate transport system substrate-binding protein